MKSKKLTTYGDLKISFDNNNSYISVKPLNVLQVDKEKWYDSKIEHIYTYVNKAVHLRIKKNLMWNSKRPLIPLFH